jgi:hypothetical protein
MTKLTRSIHLALLSSALILAGCKRRSPPQVDLVQAEEHRRAEQSLLAASTVGLLAAPAGQGPWLATASLYPEPELPPTGQNLATTSRRTGPYRSIAPWYFYRHYYGGWGRTYAPGRTAGPPRRTGSTTTRGGFGRTGHFTAGG